MDKVSMHREICEKLNEIYAAKNADYGDSFAKLRNELGDWVILVRLSDKLERLKTLLGKREEARVNESIDDTLMDLANYCIMELIERRREKQ
jgi:hypothetical protein